MQWRSKRGLNVANVDGIGVLVVGTHDLHLHTRKLFGPLLVVQLIDSLLSGVEQNVLAAHFDAGQATLRCVLGTFLLHHHIVRSHLSAFAVHDLAGEGPLFRNDHNTKSKDQRCGN